jgi:hypothetical protein
MNYSNHRRYANGGLKGSHSAGLIASRCAQDGYPCQAEGNNLYNNTPRRKRDAPMAPPGGWTSQKVEAAGTRSGWDANKIRGPKMMHESLIMKGDSFGGCVFQQEIDHQKHEEDLKLHRSNYAGCTTIELGRSR